MDNDLIARARAQLSSRKRYGGKPSPENFVNVFQGLTRCDQCRGRMHVQKSHDARSGRTYRFFRCYAAAHGAGCDRNVTYRYGDLETAVLDRILHLAMDDRFFARPDMTKGVAITVADLERKLELDRTKSANLLNMLISTASPDPIMVDMRARLTTAIAKNEAALSRAQAELEAARGATDPATHLARVLEVRSAMADPVPMTALAARDMIATAIRGVISDMWFERDHAGRKTVLVNVAGGLAAMQFDNAGKLIAQFDLSGDPAMEAGTVGQSPLWTANVRAMKRRAA